MVKETMEFVLKTLGQMGVTVTGVIVTKVSEMPTIKIEIDESKMIYDLDGTLKASYGIFWTMMYGKPNDKNRNNKIDLQYKVVGSDKS